jgi:hypothetical protein
LVNGVINPAENASLSYQAQNGAHWLTPLNGTRLGVYGNQEPNIIDCQTATMSTAPIPVESISPGAHLCFKTSSDLPGWLRLDNLDLVTQTITIEIMTWLPLDL